MTTAEHFDMKRVTRDEIEAAGAVWQDDEAAFRFPDGSHGAFETTLDGAEQRDGTGRPVFHFRALRA